MNRRVPTSQISNPSSQAATTWEQTARARRAWSLAASQIPTRVLAVRLVLLMMVISCLAVVDRSLLTDAQGQVMAEAGAASNTTIGAEANDGAQAEPTRATSRIHRELDMPFFSFAGLTRIGRR